MGNTRDVSYDSRYWGFIPKENIIGRPMFIYWSFETPADQYLHKAMSQRFSFLAHVVIHFFDKTRWKRNFQSPALTVTNETIVGFYSRSNPSDWLRSPNALPCYQFSSRLDPDLER